MTYKEFQDMKRAATGKPPEPRGAGDVLERIFRPFAKLFGLQGCSSCQRRKSWLNRLFPFR